MISNFHSPKEQSFSLWHTFKSHIPRFLLTILCDIISPLLIFLLLQKHMKSVYALLIAGIPPLIMIFIKAILSHTFDALGFLVLISFLCSAIVAVLTHNPIVLLVEKSLITVIIAFICSITLIPFRCHWRPIAYYFYQDFVPTKRKDIGLADYKTEGESLSSKEEVAQVYDWLYIHFSSFRLSCYLITSIWSIGFLLESLTRLILILIHLPINQILIYGNIILSLITVLCIILTIICITKERKKTLISIQELKRSDHPLWIVTENFNENHRIYEINHF